MLNKMVKKCLIMLCAWLMTLGEVRAQTLFFHHFTTVEGLPSNTIYDLFQDSLGYMWMGTEAGLVKYNGVGYRSLNSPLQKSRALTNLLEINNQIFGKNFSGDIVAVAEDRVEVLDFWTRKGHKGFPALSKAGKQLIVYNSSIGYVFDPFSKKENVIYNAEQHHFSILQIEKDAETYVILCLDEKGQVVIIEKNEEKKVLSSHYIKHYKHERGLLKLLKQGQKLFLFNYAYATLYEVNKDYTLSISIAAKNEDTKVKFTDFVFLNDSIAARCGYDGVDLYLNGKPFRSLLKGKAISRILQDITGNIWVATLREGVFVFPSLYSFYCHLENEEYATKFIQSKTGEIIIGTSKGNILYFKEGHITKTIKIDRTTEIQAMTFSENEKDLLVFADKLIVLNWPSGRIIKEYSVTSTKQIITKNKKYFLATSDGVYIIDAERETIEKQFLKGQRCKTAAWSETDNGLYIATQDGLYLLRDNNLIKAENINSGIENLYAGGAYLWLYTLTQEVKAYSNCRLLYTWSVKEVTNGNENVVFKDNKLWIPVKNCLKYVNLQIPFQKVSIWGEDIMNSELLNIYTVNKGMYLCFSNGIQYLTLKRESARKKEKTSIILAKIFLSGEVIRSDSKKLELPYNFRSLRLSIDVIPGRFVFGLDSIFYRLKGFHSKWIYLDNAENLIEFSSLPHGNYQLWVKVIRRNGNGVEKQLITLKIDPPFWNTWWFFLSVLLLLLTGIYFLIKLRIRSIQKRAQQVFEKKYMEKELQIAGLTALRAQMNPHFIFNSLSTIQSKVILKDTQGASDQLNKFARLMRQILEGSGEEEITIKRELQVLKDYLEIEQIRMNGDLEYSIRVNEELENLFIPSLITQPYVENALIHGLRHKTGAKKLDVDFTTDSGWIKIFIVDNGIGRNESSRINADRNNHKSFAMNAYQKRVELLNKLQNSQINIAIEDLRDSDQRPIGTRVIISLPVKTKKSEPTNA